MCLLQSSHQFDRQDEVFFPLLVGLLPPLSQLSQPVLEINSYISIKPGLIRGQEKLQSLRVFDSLMSGRLSWFPRETRLV